MTQFNWILVVFLLLLSLESVNAQSPDNCIKCHQSQTEQWQSSDHAKSMAIATNKTVLANFNNIQVTHFTQKARFFKKNDLFFAELTHQGKTQQFPIKYVFGYFPLQQYLVKTQADRYQVFPFAWDARPQSQGGQRWYPNYANEDIKLNDRLHWLQPTQNWNGMCADCHSDGLKRGFNIEKNVFHTTWDNINVSCQSCHGIQPKNHLKNNKVKSRTIINAGKWQYSANQAIATWHGTKRDNRFMDSCFACHALRSPITDGFTPNKPFLDQFSPSLLQAPLYHADGQIKEEVYVYGSFLQSKMYQAGVNCLDCHEKHTMKTKIQGNGLCLQCHNPAVFQQPTHLNHKAESKAAQCVSCHMPTNRYMGVDDRRDHSLKIPRPLLSEKYNSPNACNTCHANKSAKWAEQQINLRWGKKNRLSANETAYIELQHNLYLPIKQHLSIINDSHLSEIQRASAIMLLPNSVRALNDDIVAPWVNSSLPLIRLATAQIGYLLPLKERDKSYKKLVNDQYKAIRIKAAQNMLHKSEQQLTGITKAIAELDTANKINSWRGEGGLNRSLMYIGLQQLQPAIAALKQSIKVDPYFDASYLNLADLYRSISEFKREHATLESGIKANPKSAILKYSFGLSLVRNQQKQKALEQFKNAKAIEPNNPQYAYAYWVALDGQNGTKQALTELLKELPYYAYAPQLIELGLYLADKQKDKNAYLYLKKLSQ